MPIRLYKPTTSARRHTSVSVSFEAPRKNKLVKKLTVIKKKNSGRNNQGKITVRHQGGGEKRYIRIVDFKMDKYDIPAKVEQIEYDPNRNAYIALICYRDGERRYVLACENVKKDQILLSSQTKLTLQDGNRFPLHLIPAGTPICNIELQPKKGGKIVRSAGGSATLMGIDGGNAQIKLPSGEMRLVSKDCFATIGTISNSEFRNIRWGKAGRSRHRGIRPSVRGKVMNPCDHPHGGGEGKHPIGMKYPKTPWGKHAIGVKTRKKKKYSNKRIIRRRAKRK